MIKLIVCDLGDTLIQQVDDIDRPLDRLSLRLFDGVLQAVRLLAGSYQLAILSNTNRTNNKQLRRALQRLGISSYIRYSFTSVSIGVRKPDQRAFRAVLDAFRVRPEEAVMVGNSLAEDIVGAGAVGMHTVWRSDGRGVGGTAANRVVSSFAEVTLELVQGLDGPPAPAPAPVALPQTATKSIPVVAVTHGKSGVRDVSEIVQQERMQEWRQIGTDWFEYGKLQVPNLDPRAEEWLISARPDRATHHFPHAVPTDSAWQSLSNPERGGRAFRYAGYHFEEDGEQQTAFQHYFRSAECFWAADRSVEAARSYYLALMSFVRRYGELDDLLLEKLQKAYELALAKDEAKNLPSLIVQYRRLGAALRAAGNFSQYLHLRRLRRDAELNLAVHERRWLRVAGLKTWKITSTYGQSIPGWCGLLATVNVLVFPAIYSLPSVATSSGDVSSRVLFSLGRMIAYSPFDAALTNLGHYLTIAQAMFTLVWISVLASIIVTRSQE